MRPVWSVGITVLAPLPHVAARRAGVERRARGRRAHGHRTELVMLQQGMRHKDIAPPQDRWSYEQPGAVNNLLCFRSFARGLRFSQEIPRGSSCSLHLGF